MEVKNEKNFCHASAADCGGTGQGGTRADRSNILSGEDGPPGHDWSLGERAGLGSRQSSKVGAAAVITLVEAKELTILRVENLGEEVARREMVWFHLPIVDVSTPTAEFEKRWSEVRAQLLGMIRDGQNVLVHCRGGLGRAGMIAARLLIELSNPNYRRGYWQASTQCFWPHLH